MITCPPSPSPFVPGAWPASPSPKSSTCPLTSESNPSDPHYVCSRQHSLDLHYRKVAPQRGIFSFHKSRPNPAITSTPDDTPSSFASDDLSLHSSPAHTSFSSAYTNPPPPNFSFSLEKSTKLQDEAKSGLQEPGTSHIHQLHSNTLDVIGKSDLADLTLPEIPDLSSLSSLRDELRISRDQFNVSSIEPVSHLCLDESFLGPPHTALMKPPSLDTLSSSSIQFRRTEVPHVDSLELNAEPLCFPQPDGRNPWTLFLSPRSLCSEEPPFSHARSSLTSATSESGCKPGSSSFDHVRRSWRVGGNLSPELFLGQEETNTRRYANDLIEHAFNGCDGEPSLALNATGRDSSSTLGCLCLKHLPDGPPTAVGVPPKANFRLVMKVVKKKVHHMFTKFSMKDANTLKNVDVPSSSSQQDSASSGIRQGCSMATVPQSSCRKQKGLRKQRVQISGKRRFHSGNNRVGGETLQLQHAKRRTQIAQRPVSMPPHSADRLSHRLHHSERRSNDLFPVQIRHATTNKSHYPTESQTPQEDEFKTTQRRSFLSCISIS